MPKTIKDTPDSTAAIVASKNVIRTTVNEDKGVIVAEEGTTIQGPISFVSSTKHIAVGGLWRFNDPLRFSLPSTLATPTAVLEVKPPTEELANLVANAAPFIALLMAMSG